MARRQGGRSSPKSQRQAKRTSRPSAVSAQSERDQGGEGGTDLLGSARHRELRQNSVQSVPTGAPSQLGTGRRIRTPQPESTAAWSEENNFGAKQAQGGLLGFLQNSGSLESLGAGLLLQKLREKTDQFQHILDFVNDPVPFALRSTEINTSSTPEEVESRKAEIRYQIQIMKSVLAVLAEELEELEQARPPLNVDKPV
jgi:hypothetical protein